MRHVVEANAAKFLRVEALQLRVLYVSGEQRDASIAVLARGNEVRGCRVVEAVRRGLDDHAALDAEEAMQVEERLLRRVGGRVGGGGGEGKLLLRPEDLEVRVTGARRQLELRSRRPGVVGRLGVGHDAGGFY